MKLSEEKPGPKDDMIEDSVPIVYQVDKEM